MDHQFLRHKGPPIRFEPHHPLDNSQNLVLGFLIVLVIVVGIFALVTQNHQRLRRLSVILFCLGWYGFFFVKVSGIGGISLVIFLASVTFGTAAEVKRRRAIEAEIGKTKLQRDLEPFVKPKAPSSNEKWLCEGCGRFFSSPPKHCLICGGAIRERTSAELGEGHGSADAQIEKNSRDGGARVRIAAGGGKPIPPEHPQIFNQALAVPERTLPAVRAAPAPEECAGSDKPFICEECGRPTSPNRKQCLYCGGALVGGS